MLIYFYCIFFFDFSLPSLNTVIHLSTHHTLLQYFRFYFTWRFQLPFPLPHMYICMRKNVSPLRFFFLTFSLFFSIFRIADQSSGIDDFSANSNAEQKRLLNRNTIKIYVSSMKRDEFTLYICIFVCKVMWVSVCANGNALQCSRE